MKAATIILSVIGALVVTVGLYNMATSQTNQGVPEHVREMFINWKSEHQKGYGASAEESFRLQVFYDNYKKVNRKNAEGGATFALNLFADLSTDEFIAGYTGYKHQESPKEYEDLLGGLESPSEVDWVAQGAVNTPMQQKKCGSCYAWSTTGALEGLTFIKTGKLHVFSKQQLVNCSKPYGNNGCHGGNFEPSFRYTRDHGLVEESDYPYENSDEHSCNRAKEAQARLHKYNKGYYNVRAQSNLHLKAALSAQPVSVAVDADDLQLYHGGVFVNDCATGLNHAILAVGYGTDKETGKMYYKIKNSWGTKWGEGGFVRLERTDKENEKGKCGVMMNPVYPTA